jgi:hypothetical protein
VAAIQPRASDCTAAAVGLPPGITHAEFVEHLAALACSIAEHLLAPAYLDLARLLIAEGSRRPELNELFRTTVVEAGAEQLRNLLDEAQARRLVRSNVDTRLAVRLIAGPLLTWLFGDGLLAGGQRIQPPTRETMRVLIEILLDGLGTHATRRSSRRAH